MSAPHHVVILGCGRSGTSIFGELFEHLPGYTHYSEPPFERLLDLDYRQPVAIKVPKESNGFPASSGLSFPLDTLLSTIPAPRTVYWQLRHPLDTICSLRVGILQHWGHHPRPPDWQQWLARPLIERCAHHWNHINSKGFGSVSHLATVTRFEDMITDPQAFALSVCRDINLSAEDSQSAASTWANRVQNTNNRQFLEAKTSRAYSRSDHRIRVGRWRENLSISEVTQVLPIIESTAQNRGYHV